MMPRRVCLGIVALMGILAMSGGCALFLKDAIGVSNVSYDFRMSRQSWNLEVWNSDPADISSLALSVTTTARWLHATPAGAVSTGPKDVKIFTVSVSRQGLAKGSYQGQIVIAGSGAKSKTVTIKMTSDGTEGVTGKNLNITGISQSYSGPYLLDFTFSLRDQDNHSVIGEPNQFQVTAMEDGVPISSDENPPRLAKGYDKQQRCFLVLDYTASMASLQTQGDANHDGKSDAIEAMETAIKSTFLPGLRGDAMVGVYEFHRETAPEKVSDFSADKDYVALRIDMIWTQYVASFWGASRCWDAVYAALDEFGAEDVNDDNRSVIFISDGRDTSSIHTKEQVIDYARQRAVRVHAIGFGSEPDVGILQAVTQQTNGQYYGAPAAQDFTDSFKQILDDFQGQYTLRWATLRRTDTKFTPSFLITLGNDAADYTGTAPFAVSDFAGDELAGVLRAVPSKSGSKSTYFLRAAYVPRYIWKLRVYAQSPYPFTVQKVDVADDGLCASWAENITPDGTRPGTWIELDSPNPGGIDTSLPFAAFGPILRFDFDQAFDPEVVPFEVLYVDNTVYTGGQSFYVEGWSNVLPTP